MQSTDATLSDPSRTHLGSPQHYRWLHWIVCTVLVLNLIDAVLTLFWVWAGVAIEANDLMAQWVIRAPVVFVAIKLSLVSLGTWVLWQRRDRAFAVVGIFAVFLVYYWILAVHLDYIGVLISLDPVLHG